MVVVSLIQFKMKWNRFIVMLFLSLSNNQFYEKGNAIKAVVANFERVLFIRF